MAKKKKKMTASQAASARWTDNEDYEEEELESEAAFWWRKLGRRGHIRIVAVVIILLFGLWFILGMPGVLTHPFGI